MIEFLEVFLFGQQGVQEAGAMIAGALISAGVNIIGGLFAGGAAKKRERAARREKAKLQAKLNRLEANRQDVINPMSGVQNLSGLAQDLSGQLTNSFQNLSVATKSAEMQIEQADISLANTLDTLRSTGASAGGATALAQAALQSKKGVAASIEQQEVQNEKMKAQGEANLQAMRMQEQQRIQGVQMSEGARVQQAQAAGKQFVFNAQEEREMQQLDRVSAQLAGSEARQMQAQSDRTGALMGTIGSLAQIGSAYVGNAES